MVNVPRDKWHENMNLIVTGTVKNIKNLKTQSGKAYTVFSILYAKVGEEAYYINCQVWDNKFRRLSSDYANRLENNDMVFCTGYLNVDKYWSEKNNETQYVMVVEFIQAQTLYNNEEDDDVDLTDV